MQATVLQSLHKYFSEVANPQEVSNHLDQLLYFLVHYEHTQGVQGFFTTYCDIFELKQTLQELDNTSTQ